jgi:hypothetical protein
MTFPGSGFHRGNERLKRPEKTSSFRQKPESGIGVKKRMTAYFGQ